MAPPPPPASGIAMITTVESPDSNDGSHVATVKPGQGSTSTSTSTSNSTTSLESQPKQRQVQSSKSKSDGKPPGPGQHGSRSDRQGPLNSAMAREEIAEEEERELTPFEKKHKRKQTVLEQHCDFFDEDKDGVIWFGETYRTCRSFDWSIPWSLFFAAFLHAVQSWGTVPEHFHGLPDPLFRIWVHNVHFNKHGSSTMAFDNEGTFRPQRMDEFFEKFDKDGKGGLTFSEGWNGLRRIRMVWDAFGQVSAMFEWGFTYLLIWPEDGIVRKEDARRVLDGTIFHEKVKNKRKNDKLNGQAIRY